ncbi:MAG: hypothetical protein ACYCV7_05335 [Acidimicrobiales bacterium]
MRNLRSTRPGRGGLTAAAGLAAIKPSLTESVSNFFNVTGHRVAVAGASSPDMVTVHAATSLRRRSARRTAPNRGSIRQVQMNCSLALVLDDTWRVADHRTHHCTTVILPPLGSPVPPYRRSRRRSWR